MVPPTTRGPLQPHEAEFIVSLRQTSSKYSEGEKALFKTLPFQAIQPDRNETAILNRLDIGLEAVTEEFKATLWSLHAKEYLENGSESLKRKAARVEKRVTVGGERFKSKEAAAVATTSTSTDGPRAPSPPPSSSVEPNMEVQDTPARPPTKSALNAKVVLNSRSLEEILVMAQDKRLKRAKKLDHSHPGWRSTIPPLFSPSFLATLDEPAKLFLSLFNNATHSFSPKPVTVASQDIAAMVQLRTLLDHKTISGGALWNSWEAEGRGGDTLTLAATLWATASGRSHSWKRGMGRHDLKRARQDELWDAATPSGSPLIDQPLPAKRSRDAPSHLGDFVVKEEEFDLAIGASRK